MSILCIPGGPTPGRTWEATDVSALLVTGERDQDAGVRTLDAAEYRSF